MDRSTAREMVTSLIGDEGIAAARAPIEQAEASRLVQDSYFELDDLLAVRDQIMGAAR